MNVLRAVAVGLLDIHDQLAAVRVGERAVDAHPAFGREIDDDQADRLTHRQPVQGVLHGRSARMVGVSQIAGLLGYTEQSTLNRSCRRWFGMTPRQYRASALGT